jgi:hypothetical protein
MEGSRDGMKKLQQGRAILVLLLGIEIVSEMVYRIRYLHFPLSEVAIIAVVIVSGFFGCFGSRLGLAVHMALGGYVALAAVALMLLDPRAGYRPEYYVEVIALCISGSVCLWLLRQSAKNGL